MSFLLRNVGIYILCCLHTEELTFTSVVEDPVIYLLLLFFDWQCFTAIKLYHKTSVFVRNEHTPIPGGSPKWWQNYHSGNQLSAELMCLYHSFAYQLLKPIFHKYHVKHPLNSLPIDRFYFSYFAWQVLAKHLWPKITSIISIWCAARKHKLRRKARWPFFSQEIKTHGSKE